MHLSCVYVCILLIAYISPSAICMCHVFTLCVPVVVVCRRGSECGGARVEAGGGGEAGIRGRSIRPLGKHKYLLIRCWIMYNL